MIRTLPLLLLLETVAAPLAAAPPQDGNVLFPVATIERRLSSDTFRLADFRGSRGKGDRTQRVTLVFNDSSVMIAKWASAAPGGETFNNVPRYEVAAYELQKLFLSEPEYVVPVTVMRAVSVDWLRTYDEDAYPTFDGAASVVVVLQYWLSQVTGDDVFDRDRLAADSVYARHFGNANVLTYLIGHKDANAGNILVSTVPSAPRVFSVDNGVAFRSEESDRGDTWKSLRVEALPHATVERLRALTPERLEQSLAVVAQFEIRDRALVAVPRGPRLEGSRGVRRSDAVIQFGLTDAEIRDVSNRLKKLLERVDEGKITTF